VRRHLRRTGTRRAVRPGICPDWLWAARRSGSESPVGRVPRWHRLADPATSQTFEAKLACVIGERSRNVYGEEQRRNLTDHVPSLLHIPAGADARVPPAPLSLRENSIFECKDVLNGSSANWTLEAAARRAGPTS